MPPMLMEHLVDPAEELKTKIGMRKDGTIPGFQLHGNRVLVGIYVRPAVTKSRIHIPDQVLAEDIYQGKAGLVLSMGHSAFISDRDYDFGPDTVKVGDWVMLFVSHGLACSVNGVKCRIVRDLDITMRIPAPDQVF